MKPLVVISRRDNVGTTQDLMQPGDRVIANGLEIVAREPIPAGHKIAIARIAAGSGVIKYGSAIGVATADIEPGAHVHTHNVASTRGRGDLHAAVPAGQASARIAEPPDEATATEGGRG
jgi:altronate dehydratase small subunit